MKNRWAQGIPPRNFTWVLKDQLAVSERPGGYARSHRPVRRQEEIIWIREQGFTRVISVIPATHNLHNYDELGLPYRHHPFSSQDDPRALLAALYPELRAFGRDGVRVILHGEDVGDRVAGVLGGYLRWAGLVPEPPKAVSIIETIVARQLGPVGRSLVTMATEVPRAEV